MRLSPAHLGAELLHHERLAEHGLEQLESEPRLLSSGRMRNTDAPPLPYSGLMMMSLWLDAERLHVVEHCASPASAASGLELEHHTFSGALRTWAGSLTTSVFG
jgi:hypothetical protein